MIRFDHNYSGVATIEKHLKGKERVSNLPNTLYVFGAGINRPFAVYLSPLMPNAATAAQFLNQHAVMGRWGEVVVEEIGSSPYKNWVAFNRSLRDSHPEICAAVALFLEQVINNLITW